MVGRVGLCRSVRSGGRGRVSVGGNSFSAIPVSIVAIWQSGYNIGRHNRTHRGHHWVATAAAAKHFPRCSVGIVSRLREATGEASTVTGTIQHLAIPCTYYCPPPAVGARTYHQERRQAVESSQALLARPETVSKLVKLLTRPSEGGALAAD